jgi:hypothetical protein
VGGDQLTVAQTDFVEQPEAHRTILLTPPPEFPESEREADRPEAPQVRFAPEQFQTSATLGQSRRGGLSIMGLGTGGSDFSKYGLSVGTRNGAPESGPSITGLGAGGSDFGGYGLGAGPGGTGPRFFGLGGTARGAQNIVYVVDRSGSMTGTFGAVRDELKRSVERLRRSMRFHVILFNAGPPLENPAKQLVHASREEKAALAEFLDTIQPNDGTDPIPAMRRAFALGPDVIYFLTDGEFEPQLLEELRKWNQNKKVRIFTIAYVSPTGATLLEQIAREHNGQYRFVSEHDL